MVSQASVNAKVAYGFTRAAAALGAACEWYRPDGMPDSPLQYRIGTMTAAFRIPNTAYTTPSNYAKPLWWGLFDTTTVQAGDYLIDPSLGTFFVASVEPIHYPLCISCNSMLSFGRPTTSPIGADHYGGGVYGDTTPLGMYWPASVLNGTKGEASDQRLPGDTRAPWVAILLPPSFPAQLLTGDIAITSDPIQARYTLSACELTSNGWRLTGSLAVP